MNIRNDRMDTSHAKHSVGGKWQSTKSFPTSVSVEMNLLTHSQRLCMIMMIPQSYCDTSIRSVCCSTAFSTCAILNHEWLGILTSTYPLPKVPSSGVLPSVLPPL